MQILHLPADGLLRRWQRAHLRVRCGLTPDEPLAICRFIELGTHLSRCRVASALDVQRRTLAVLLQAACDESLPWRWRSVCLEHAPRPLAHLTTLLRAQHPAALRALQAAYESAQRQLPASASCRL